MITYKDFSNDEHSDAYRARKLLDQYDGNQTKWVEARLNGAIRGGWGYRYKWLERGFEPHCRNIVKPIVEKSSNLFQNPAKYEILPSYDAKATPVVDAKLHQILSAGDWHEFAQQLDRITRLLRSTCVYQTKVVPDGTMTEGGIYRFNEDRGDQWVPMLLHVGNSVVKMNLARTKITELAYLTSGTPGDFNGWSYMYVSSDVIEERLVEHNKESVIPGTRRINPDGLVTASMFYDTDKPRAPHVWAKVPEDIGSFQDMFNTHLTDLAFALATQKGQTLIITNAKIQSTEEPSYSISGIESTQVKPTEEATIGGIGSVMALTSPPNATQAPTADFKGPSVDLKSHYDVMAGLVEDIAFDWSVRLKMSGQGSASSGFQLVVEEMDNLELRQTRAKSFQGAMRRFYDIMSAMYPELTDGMLQVVFAPPSLPVNNQEELNLWTQKIEKNLASVVDYFMAVDNLSQEEAIAKALEVKEMNQILSESTSDTDAETDTEVDTDTETDTETDTDTPDTNN